MTLLEIDEHMLRLGGFFVIILILVIGFLILYFRSLKKGKIKSAQLKADYQAALKSGDKKLALQKGRLYYQNLRGNGRLTIYDEQAITNDISTM